MSKHMTLEERQQIQMALNNGENFSQIAQLIGKNRSTVTREVRSHRIVWEHHAYGRSGNRCINRFSCALKHLCDPDCRKKCSLCGKCKTLCGNYLEEHCSKLSLPPYVCNCCPDLHKCSLEIFRYDASYAQKEYRTNLKESREGFNLSEAELQTIDDMISPLLKQGQSVHHAVHACKDRLSVSDRTIYRLTDKSALKARNIDLPRKCKLKPRKGARPHHKIDRSCRIGRSYADYIHYLAGNPSVLTVQMDSVVGASGSSKVLLTLWFHGDFMPVFIRDSNSAASVLEWIEFIYSGLGHDDFCKLFPVILTDNGTEFSDPSAIETAPDGRQRTKVFYCDPMASYQKPNVERCHELFRRILPKGTSFDSFSQAQMITVASHVNSYARANLGDKTPMDALVFYYGDTLANKLLRLLGQTRISPENIVLLPDLLK